MCLQFGKWTCECTTMITNRLVQWILLLLIRLFHFIVSFTLAISLSFSHTLPLPLTPSRERIFLLIIVITISILSPMCSPLPIRISLLVKFKFIDNNNSMRRIKRGVFRCRIATPIIILSTIEFGVTIEFLLVRCLLNHKNVEVRLFGRSAFIF